LDVKGLETSPQIDGNTTFKEAMIDDPHFIDYTRGFTNDAPEKIGNKKELRIKLLQRVKDENYVAHLLSMSGLPD
jgi:hypothetical protein